VDGRLDEPVWRRAARLTGFSQYAPVDGRPAEQATEVLVWYAPDAIHFGVRAEARPGSVKATLADRDKLGDEDLVEFFLGTYHDGRQALVFGVNPFGVQRASRGRQRSGGTAGRTPTQPGLRLPGRDGSRTAATRSRRIPFKSIRYQSPTRRRGARIVRRFGGTGSRTRGRRPRRGSPSSSAGRHLED
jgi:hypothetical protein